MEFPKTWLKRALFAVAGVVVLAAGTSIPGSSSEGPTASTKTTVARSARKTSSKRRRARRQRGQKAPTTDRIKEIQVALAREGTFTGTPTGKWDAATVEAMKRFQAAQGLNPTGKLDALSLQKLGLGSEIAGRAAPKPPAQSQNGAVNRP